MDKTPKHLLFIAKQLPSIPMINQLRVDNGGRENVKLRSFSATAYASVLTSEYQGKLASSQFQAFNAVKRRKGRKRFKRQKQEGE